MTPKFVEKATQLAMNPTECNWFQFFAQETWDRIRFARTRKGLKIFETTVTQNMVFEFLSSKAMYSPVLGTWGIEIQESRNEKTNGADIELYVDIGGNLYFFALQAKIINHEGYRRSGMVDGNYRYINHQVSGVDQIDLLMNYALRKGGIPLYLLYNFVNNTFRPAERCNVDYEIEQFGCSIIGARHIDRTFRSAAGSWSNVRFCDLHPSPALPWFALACCFQGKNITGVLEMLNEKSTDLNSLVTYELADIQNDRNWQPMQAGKSADQIISESFNELSSSSINEIDFNPKFRMVISPLLGNRIVRKSPFVR